LGRPVLHPCHFYWHLAGSSNGQNIRRGGGGNVTGFAIYEASLGGKWLELLSEIAPGLKRAAIMFNPDTVAFSVYMPSFETAAQSLKVVPTTAPVHSDIEIETAIILVVTWSRSWPAATGELIMEAGAAARPIGPGRPGGGAALTVPVW
jgi:hypothetical protein